MVARVREFDVSHLIRLIDVSALHRVLVAAVAGRKPGLLYPLELLRVGMTSVLLVEEATGEVVPPLGSGVESVPVLATELEALWRRRLGVSAGNRIMRIS